MLWKAEKIRSSAVDDLPVICLDSAFTLLLSSFRQMVYNNYCYVVLCTGVSMAKRDVIPLIFRTQINFHPISRNFNAEGKEMTEHIAYSGYLIHTLSITVIIKTSHDTAVLYRQLSLCQKAKSGGYRPTYFPHRDGNHGNSVLQDIYAYRRMLKEAKMEKTTYLLNHAIYKPAPYLPVCRQRHVSTSLQYPLYISRCSPLKDPRRHHPFFPHTIGTSAS